MAKLNWQKLAHQQQHDRNRRAANRHDNQKKLEKVWQIGKYYGKKLDELPLDYLIWASENLGENNYHKLKADSELIRRHNLLAQKVGGPDRNTAVKKLGDKKPRHATH
jgi:hypothetical protein